MCPFINWQFFFHQINYNFNDKEIKYHWPHGFQLLFSGGQTIREGLQERSEVLSNLEEKSQALVQFVSSGESARIKARLTQIGRYWEELKESVEHLSGQLEETSSHQTKFNTNLQQVHFKHAKSVGEKCTMVIINKIGLRC